MPSQSEIKWSQLKVGTLVVSALAALIVLIFLMSNSSGGLLTKKISLLAYFENANGLKVGAPVTLDGVTIGNVTVVRILPHHEPGSVEVECKVGAQYLPSLHTDSKVEIVQAGVLGDSYVDILSTHASGPEPKDHAVLQAASTPGIQDVIRTSQDTIAAATDVIHKLGNTVDKINQGQGTAGVMMNDPQLAKKISSTITQLSAITDQVSSGKGTLGKLVYDETMYDQLSQTVARLNTISAGLANGQGTAGKLLKDDTLYKNLNEAVANTNGLLATVNSGQGSLGKLAKDPAFAQQLSESVTRLNSILKDVDEGKGTMGQLLVNRSLYDNANSTLEQGSQLITAMRQDPKKYLTVHVKLF